jgi:hypothetical protein
MGECCAGPPPLCEVLIHTKRGNRAIRRTRPEALFPPSKASGQFSAGYPSKEAAWPQPANFGEGYSLLKNPSALTSVPGSAAKYDFIVVFRPCFWALLECRSGRQLLFQQAVSFPEGW